MAQICLMAPRSRKFQSGCIYLWENLNSYMFPPFSLITKVLNKTQLEKAECIMLFPMWKSQPWFPMLEKMLSSEIVILNPNHSLLLSPFRSPHPLWASLTLGAARLSGKLLLGKTSPEIP